jgi:histidinol-phosphate aminotransferase
MPKFINFTHHANSLPATVPFVGPETPERATGTIFKARLGANENGFGFAPSVAKVLTDQAYLSWRYGDPESFDLKTKIAQVHHIGFENIAIGSGIDSLLGLIIRMIVEKGTDVVTSLGAYPTFNFHVVGFGGQIHAVPFKNDFEDLEGLLAKVLETDAKLVYLSNPDNPMGTMWAKDKIIDFIDQLPESTMLILDEAYCELAEQGSILDADQLLDRPNVVRMRTFSKAYGMAGLRVGYAIGSVDTIAMFDRVRNHFGMNRLSQKAAVAAISDQAWLDKAVQKIERARQRISQIAIENGFLPIQSATNFVTFDCGRDGDYARKVLAGLTGEGIFVRMPGVAPLDRCVRVSAAPDNELDLLAEALPLVIKSLAD